MIEFKLENLDQLREVYDPKIVDKALTRSINRIAVRARKKVSQTVRAEFNIKARDIAKALRFKRAKSGSNEAVLMYAGSRIGLHKFGMRTRTVKVKTSRYGRTRQQVRVKVRKTSALTPAVGRVNVLFKGSHVTQGFESQGRIYARKGKGRYPLMFLKGPSIPAMVDQDTVLNEVQALMNEEFAKEFERNMEFYLMRRVGLV